MRNSNIVISTKTIFLAFLILALAWMFYSIFSVILYIFTATIIVLGLEPAVLFLVKRGVPRGVSALLVFFFFLSIIVLVAGFAVVPMVSETQNLFYKFPSFIDSLSKYQILSGATANLIDSLFSQIPLTSKSILNVTVGAFSTILSFVSVMIFTVYLLADFENVRVFIANLLPKKSRPVVVKTIALVEKRLGAWIRGELILMTVVGVFTFVGLSIIGMDYTLSLALIAGFLEIIPTIGPIISAIPALIVGFAINPTMGLLVILVYVLVQQLENNLFVPKIMQKAVGLNPLVTLIAVLVGGKLLGFTGMLFAVPVVLIIQTIVETVAESD